MIVDFIGHYERLEHDFARVCPRIGIRPPPLPHRRQAVDRTDYRRYYTDEMAALVADHFAADIVRFGYAFDDPATLAGPGRPA